MDTHLNLYFRHLLVVMIGAMLAVLFTSWGVQAQGGYPEPTDLYINDYASLLSAEDAANIKSMFVELKQKHGIEATVVTINSISDYNTSDESIESFATRMFNTWGIGDKAKNNGVLLLVAAGNRKVKIEVGSGYGTSQDAAMQEVINEHILSSFREGNFSRGIYRGSRGIVGKLTGEWPEDLTASSSSSSSENSSSSGESSLTSSSTPSSNPLALLVTLIGGGSATLGALGLGLRQYFRHRKRPCPDCQTMLVRLDETADDVYLDSGQKLEELLNSIDYDVWKCPNCNYHTLHSYRNWLSGLKKCPRCSYRTVKVSSETITHATYSSSGKKRITKDCQKCNYHHREFMVIPRKTRSSSSSSSGGSSGGSSFGGGSSSGGGASGSW